MRGPFVPFGTAFAVVVRAGLVGLLIGGAPQLWAQSPPAAETARWSGEFTLTMKGRGTNERAVQGVPGGKARLTWDVDRVARGRIVLDRMFKGGGIAGTPDTRNTDRYETWIANRPQPIELMVNDTGTYFGLIPSGKIALDETRYECPKPDERRPTGQVRSGILQFDRQKGTFSFETPRMIHRCATSIMRTPKHGPADWMGKAPFPLLSNPIELEFDVTHALDRLPAWVTITGPYVDGATELVLSRKFTFNWMNPMKGEQYIAPVEAELVLVLRKEP